MSDPYGGPFPPWDEETAYAKNDIVSYKGYLYQLRDATSTGDNPLTATFTETLTNRIGPGTSTATFRKWALWDYPVGHYMARLRGLPAFELTALPQARTFCVRGDFDDRTENYTYPTSASYEGYGMPAGLDTNWPLPDHGELMAAPSEVPFDDYGWGRLVPKKYPYQPSIGGDEAVCFQPNTVSAQIYSDETSPGVYEDYLLPAWSAETLGQMFACSGTFSREYTFRYGGTNADTSSTPAFVDNWEAEREFTGYDNLDDIIGTDPDLRTDT